MKGTKLLEASSLVLATLGLLGCRNGDEVPRGPDHEPVPARAEHRASGAAAVSSVAVPPAHQEEIVSVPSSPGDVGNWADSPSYRFRVNGSKRCARRPAPENAEVQGPLLALSVEVFAKYDELLVAGRDVKLESAGIILDSEVDPQIEASCGALLRPQQLRQGQTASGVVLFAIPPEFETRSVVVTYRATRWGGAPRLEVRLPAPAFSVALKR